MPAPETIRIQAIDDFGGPEVFATHRVPKAAPGPGKVAITVAATSVNPVDLSTQAGENIPIEEARFPMVLGWDVAGTVEEVGDGVSGPAVGDRVAAMSFQPHKQIGTYAERVILDASLLAPLPEGMSFATAASVPLVGVAARQALDALDLSPGAVLFVNAPVGAVGRMVVQLAARDGIVVVGSVADADAGLARGLGAREIVSRAGDLAGADPRPASGGSRRRGRPDRRRGRPRDDRCRPRRRPLHDGRGALPRRDRSVRADAGDRAEGDPGRSRRRRARVAPRRRGGRRAGVTDRLDDGTGRSCRCPPPSRRRWPAGKLVLVP